MFIGKSTGKQWTATITMVPIFIWTQCIKLEIGLLRLVVEGTGAPPCYRDTRTWKPLCCWGRPPATLKLPCFQEVKSPWEGHMKVLRVTAVAFQVADPWVGKSLVDSGLNWVTHILQDFLMANVLQELSHLQYAPSKFLGYKFDEDHMGILKHVSSK